MATRIFGQVIAPSLATGDTIGASKNLNPNIIADESLMVGALGFGVVNVSSTTSTAAATTYYKLRGWNSSTLQFETWTNTDPYSNPPSQATLLDITYTEFNS